MLTAFRGRLAENQNDPDLAGLADRLHAASAEFREWWPRQDVVYQLSLALETRHREVGVLRFTATTLRPEAAPLLRLLIWTPDPETRARLRKLLAD
jgi:hypothetical protein